MIGWDHISKERERRKFTIKLASVNLLVSFYGRYHIMHFSEPYVLLRIIVSDFILV